MNIKALNYLGIYWQLANYSYLFNERVIRKHRIGLGLHALIDSVFEYRPYDLDAHMDIFRMARKHLSTHTKGGSGVAERTMLYKAAEVTVRTKRMDSGIDK